MFQSLDHVSSFKEKYRFITFLKAELLLFTKQFQQTNFTSDSGQELIKLEAKVMFAVGGLLILSSDIPLDFQEKKFLDVTKN